MPCLPSLPPCSPVTITLSPHLTSPPCWLVWQFLSSTYVLLWHEHYALLFFSLFWVSKVYFENKTSEQMTVFLFTLLPLLSSWASQPVDVSGWMQKRLHKEVWRRKAQKVLFFLHTGKSCCLHLYVKTLRCRIISDLCKITAYTELTWEQASNPSTWAVGELFIPSGVCSQAFKGG